MDDKDFKKHLRDLAHGHHHPEEHDWASDTVSRKPAGRSGTKRKPVKAAAKKTVKSAAKKPKRKAA